MYFHATDDGQPDFSRPMNQAEMIQAYWDSADEDPHSLAELYVDFHDFSTIEFLVFVDRLSATILVANSARNAISKLRNQLKHDLKDGSRRVDGWEGESDALVSESVGVAEQAESYAIGAAIVTAVTALEVLFQDLVQKSSVKRAGLSRLVTGVLQERSASPQVTERIEEMVDEVRKLRNKFAHSLTGSYFDASDRESLTFDSNAFHSALFTVGRIAIELDALVQ